MASRSQTGIAAILAGALIFAGQAGELAFGSPSDFVDDVFVALWTAGTVALCLGLLGLRQVIQGTRRGRIGVGLALVGLAFLGLFAVQLVVQVARTGDVPDNFLLFAIGFLLVLVGQLLFARDLQPAVGRRWILPVVGVVGLLVGLLLEVDPIHDIGLFVFEGAWVALGIALIRSEHSVAPRLAAART